MSQVTGKPYFGTPTNNGFDDLKGGADFGGVGVAEPGGGAAIGPNGVLLPVPNVAVAECPPDAACIAPQPVQAADSSLSLGFPRDTFWPKSTAAFLALGVVLTLASAQLVAPTRRWRLRRPGWRRKPQSAGPDETAETQTSAEASSELETPITETPA
jgi:hypothetical protein